MKKTAEKKSRLLGTSAENEDQTRDPNNGLEAKISKEKTRTTLTMDLQEILSQLIRNSLPVQTSQVRTIFRIMEDHMINAQISHSIEMIEMDLEMDLSTIRMETSATMEFFLILQRLKGETSLKIDHTANHEVINLTFWLSADLIFDLLLVLHLTDKNFHKTMSRRHLK